MIYLSKGNEALVYNEEGRGTIVKFSPRYKSE